MKRTLKITSIVLSLLSALLLLASCGDMPIPGMGGEHVHEYGEWEITKAATCTQGGERARFCSCGEKQESVTATAPHTFGADNICTLCGRDANGVCAHKNKTTVPATEATCTVAGTTAYEVCTDCKASLTTPAAIPPSHKYENGACTACKEACPHERTAVIAGYAATCVYDGLTNGEKCSDCGMITKAQEIISAPGHNYVDGICSNCGDIDYGGNGDTPNVEKTNLLIQLYENDCNGEFSSTLKRYCAGQDTAGTEEIDTLVRNRNVVAMDAAGVTVTYNYETNYGWGGSIQDIQALAKSGSGSAPDIFANFSYDMTSCVLRGCFANLYANTDRTATTYGNGDNHFTFTKEGYAGLTPNQYFDYNAGQGYFYDYMQSLTFANENGVYDRMYCLASNYTLDAIRAMAVVPVNIDMLESIPVEKSTGDLDCDGDFDIDDFYHLVWSYEWTYDTLAQLSNAIYSDDNRIIDGADIIDTLGFAVGRSSGLCGAGILYSSSVKFINKVTTDDGKITYVYPDTNRDLFDITDALYEIFNGDNGICTISSEEAKSAGVGDVKDDLDAIRKRFAINKVLFGGVIVVGSLEDTLFQHMNTGEGFGFVPVPLYKQDENHTEQYNTLIHNFARIFAISATTTEFEKCTAFLDYVSTNSAEIVEKYVYNTLVASIDESTAHLHNAYMFNFIKNHARDGFDKTYDDIIANYQSATDSQAHSNRWHTILYTHGFTVSNMETRYEEQRIPKQSVLETIIAEWAKLK